MLNYTLFTVHRDRKDKEKDEISRMPKAKDEQAPVRLIIEWSYESYVHTNCHYSNTFFSLQNFVASNKYSMLPDDVDPDNIDD